MTYEKPTHAGEPCLARRKKINLTGFTLAGAAALFVALAGNAPAIPFTLHDEVVNAGIRSQSLRREQNDYEMVLALGHGNRNQSLGTPTAVILPAPARVKNTGPLGNSSPQDSRRRKRGHGAVPTSSPSPDETPSPAGVPDGGSTAVLLGGVFCGLVLLEKKLQA